MARPRAGLFHNSLSYKNPFFSTVACGLDGRSRTLALTVERFRPALFQPETQQRCFVSRRSLVCGTPRLATDFFLHGCGGLAVRQCASQQSCCLKPNSAGTPTALQRGSTALRQSCCLKPNGARSPTALSANRPTTAQVHCIVPRLPRGQMLSTLSCKLHRTTSTLHLSYNQITQALRLSPTASLNVDMKCLRSPFLVIRY